MLKVTKISPNVNAHSPYHQRLRVAAYARVSTDSDEQMQSFDAQVEHYTTFIKSKPEWEFVGVYADEGISGTKQGNRPELMRLLADCENRKIDFIITKSISRFARNTTDCLKIVRRLTELSVFILFEKENINTRTADSELILTILSSLAAEESVSISKNCKWSIRNRFKNGTYKLSSPPYGYDYKGETLVLNPVQAQIVRRIFEDTLAGSGMDAIAQRLNSEHVKPPRNTRWSAATIRGILSNEKYIGDVLYQKTYTGDQFDRHRNTGEEDQFYIAEHHEAIITPEEFKRAAAVVRQRGLEKGVDPDSDKYSSRYVFSGMIRCGSCGGTFKRRVHSPNKQSQYVAWCCVNHIRKECPMLFVRDLRIKTAFVTMINKLYSNRQLILKPLLMKLREVDSEARVAEIMAINAQIDEVHRHQMKVTELYTNNMLEPAFYQAKQNSMRAERNRLDEKIQIIQAEVTRDTAKRLETEELYKYLNKRDGIIEDFDDVEFGRFVSEIVVLSSTEIGFKLKCGLRLKEQIER